jgi:hypothetical protein
MKIHILGVSCLKLANTTNDDKVFVGLILMNVNMLRLDCKKLLHGQIFF